MRRRLSSFSRLIPLVLVAAVLLTGGEAQSAGRHTVVSIKGTNFLINKKVTFPGTPARGLLLNSRMAQAIFDDENPATVGNWVYPDTGLWDPQRNVSEFVAAVPTYAKRGLRAVSINLQGGSPTTSKPGFSGNHQISVVSAYRANGSLKPAWLERLERVIRACDRQGVVVILGLFYFGQDERLEDEQAVIRGADRVTDWLLRKRFTNVLMEVGNETDLNYDQSILQPARVAALMARVEKRARGRLKVSTSFAGGSLPSSAVLARSDFILVHGNGQTPQGIASMLDRIRADPAYLARPRPIVFNEDSPNVANMEVAVSKHASWGYYDQGKNNYVDGFQSPPVNWSIDTPNKIAFFNHVWSLTRKHG
jgi:hypothetical protein